MIKTFTHKGLKDFFFTGSIKGIQAKHKQKLRLQLAMLDVAVDVKDMDKPGWNLHQLKGRKTDTHSVKVNGNWRMTFRIEDGHAYIVNYEDYH